MQSCLEQHLAQRRKGPLLLFEGPRPTRKYVYTTLCSRLLVIVHQVI